MDTLAYAVDLENKDFLGTEIDDQQLASLLAPTSEESAHEEIAGKTQAVQVKKVPVVEQVDFETIDNKNQVQLESEAAISDVEVSQITSDLLDSVREPLQPSKEASVLDFHQFGEEAAPAPPKLVVPKKPAKPLSVAEVVKKTLELQKKKDSDAQDLFKAKKPTASSIAASVTPKKSTESHKHKHKKSKTEIEKEDTQLDNLFVTIESELQTNDEAKQSKPKSELAKEPQRAEKNHKHHHHKHKHHAKKQEESLVQIEHKHEHAKKHHGKKKHHSKHKKTHGSKHVKQEESLLQLSADVSLGSDELMGIEAEDRDGAVLQMESIGELQHERKDEKYAKSGLKEGSLANPLLGQGLSRRERKVPASSMLLQVGSQLAVEAQS